MAANQSDLLVIGAGPAGAAAAIEGRQRGLDVTVIDKASFPRDKCCGDGLTAGALRHLDQLGLDPARVPSWKVVNDVHITAPNGRSRMFPLPRDNGQFAAIARRRELDAALVDLARAGGARVLEQTSLEAISPSADRVTVRAGGTTFDAQFVVAADGMWSPTRRMLGLNVPDYRGEWHAFRQYFRNVSSRAANDLMVWFDADLLPGYIWSFPLADGSANVGFGIQRGRNHSIQQMKALWPEILARPHVAGFLGEKAVAENRHSAWPIPARLGRSPLTAERVLFVGDAATATDPMTGEGIGQAIETGRLAASVIADAGPRSTNRAKATSAFELHLTQGMVRDHALAQTLSTALGSKAGANAAIATAGLTSWTRRNFSRWLFEDYPRAVIGTPRRWHRQVFTSPGAYR
ncbi:MAG: geranylgeranyl reductase family protein [Acidimicrobiales bacterium]